MGDEYVAAADCHSGGVRGGWGGWWCDDDDDDDDDDADVSAADCITQRMVLFVFLAAGNLQTYEEVRNSM